MKPLTAVVLVASLAFNALLAYVAFAGRSRLAEDQAAATAARAATPALPTGPAPLDPGTWARLNPNDLSTLVTRLRDAGFPKEMIRAILTGLIGEQFAARHRALDPDAASRAFWKDASPDPRFRLAQFQLYRDQAQTLRDLLGPDARQTDPLTLARLRSRFGNLPPDKLDTVQTIESDFNLRRSEFFANRVGSATMADMAALDRELRTAFAAVLSPAELEEYDLRSSRTGQSMRTDLAAFNPTEEEFRAIFRLRQSFDERYNFNSGILGQEQMRDRGEAQKQLAAQISSLLGPVRGAEYERSIDINYRQTSQLVARLELPPVTTANLWNTQKEFEKRRDELYAALRDLPPEQRTERARALSQQVATLHQEALARVTPLLGSPSRVEAYKQYGGSWIQNLVPRPAPTAAPAR